MCRTQLVKLRPHVKELQAEGAAVFGMSLDTPAEASRLVSNLGLPFALLSDPNMVIVRDYGMYGKAMKMPEMGYVVIDREGRIRAREIDRSFGANVNAIRRALRAAKREA